MKGTDPSRSVRLASTAVVLALVGCSGESVCTAIGWTDGLTVELDGDWGPAAPGSLTIDCSSPCGGATLEGSGSAGAAVMPVSGPTTSVPLVGAPESVTVTVVAADGTELATHEAELDWVRVGGSEECGGPHEATVVVHAPSPEGD